MNVLQFDTIDRYWKSLENIDMNEVTALIDKLGKEQPFILAFLMSSGQDIFSQEEREVLLYMGVMIWQIATEISSDIPLISDTVLDDFENRNFSMLEYLDGEPESDFNGTVSMIMKNYHQTDFLQYVIDRLMEELKTGSDLKENNTGIIAIYLKTVIDCFDASV